MPAGDSKEIGQRLEGLKLAPQVQLPAKVAPGTRAQTRLNVASNVWGVFPAQNIPVYRYDFRVLEEYPPKKEGGEPGMKEVTKQTREDYISIDRKNKCVAAYKTLLEREKKFFGDMSSFVYDRASIFYSLDQLKIGPDETKSFYISRNELPPENFSEECVKLHVNIKRCTEDFQLTTTDFKSGVSSNPDQINRSVQQFYELLLSQEAFFIEGRFVCYGSGECYLLSPDEFGFREQDAPPLPDGKYVGVGASKAVKIIEGPNKGVNMAVHIDVKKAAFHIDYQVLADKVAAICNSRQVGEPLEEKQIKMLSKMLKGLYVRCTYGKHKAFGIHGIGNQTAATLKFKQENRMVSLTDYFQQKYKQVIRYTKLPLVIEKTPKGINYYPMELLQVCENQRVSLTQQSSQQVQQMIRACATAPYFRARQMLNMAGALKLDKAGRENRWLKEMKIKLSESNLTLEARVLQKPAVYYANNAVAPMKENTTWSLAGNTQYLVPAACQKWCLIALTSANDRFTEETLGAYTTSFLTRCRQRGMKIDPPLFKKCVMRARESDVALQFEEAQKANATFIHFITSENLKYHDKIKFLENQTQILTQDLLTKNAAAVQQKSQTLDNIVHKTNLKLGGLNFELRLESKELQKWIGRGDRLIIGIDLAFATIPKGSEKRVPTAVGYASNCRKHPLDFIGGYRYAWSQMEELAEGDETVKDLVSESLQRAKVNRQVPGHIFVLRDGVSEGQYKYVVQNEVEQIKKACAAAGGGKYRPHITVLVATKKHNLRLYRNPKDLQQGLRVPDQNIPPGTVVDQQIVNPATTEFYLNSHTALQGTAKTPRYNLVFDTSKMTADEMQAVVYALTFNLQIVTQACSLPAPVMIADHMATRGRNNYNARFGDSSGSSGEEINLEHLNAELGYMGKKLADWRFNA